MITKPARGGHDLRPTDAGGRGGQDQNLRIDLSEEEAPPRLSRARENSFRLLARWLLSAARKGAPVVDPRPVKDSQNRLDVARGAKVGSDYR